VSDGISVSWEEQVSLAVDVYLCVPLAFGVWRVGDGRLGG